MATVLNARLNQVIAVGGEPRSAFFNGRMLSAEDLTREQAARDDAEARLARLVGCGVAEGLTVTGGTGSVLHISAGLGVTPSGAVIDIGNLDLDLSSAGRGASFSGFGNCAAGLAEGQPLAGLYLLTLTPAWSGQGRAATLLGEVGACNRRTQQPAVRARLVEVQPPAGLGAASVRNELAVALLSPGQGLAAAPEGGRVGWWMRQRVGSSAAVPGLTADELPLALLQIDAAARPLWIDTDSARRRLAAPPGGAGDAMWPESWAVEMQAFAAQFVAELMGAKANAAAFVWLPPTLPLTAAQLAKLRAVVPGVPGTAEVLNRSRFARALIEGWDGAPVRRQGAALYLARLEGQPERLLLRAGTGAGGPGDGMGTGGGERTSAKVASAAARVLAAGRQPRAGGPSKDELAAAASALTQAPDRKNR
ncbi:hypothetical protein [Roseateles sp. LYH14W]|uniref:FAD-binding PCMH-type domain-containing protein n=1 Tax=Pelomonas parva TaxID=3299032 RepID=A0ABW7EW29_9BURK